MAYIILDLGYTASAGIQYTATTDTSADWGDVDNETYFFDKETELVYFKDASGNVGSIYTSVGLTMPTAFSVANTPITQSGSLDVTANGLASQYIRGDGTLADFPHSTGGGSSVVYYFNGGTNQGTFGGSTYYEMNKTAVIGSQVTFQTIGVDGLLTQFITDALDPNLLEIPAGNWVFGTYFDSNSGTGNPYFYVELLKWDGTTFTSIATNSANPEFITKANGVDVYYSQLGVPQTILLATDRLAIRFYVTTGGRTITFYTQGTTISQVTTTFSFGLTALNGLTDQVQYFQTGTSGTDFGISSSVDIHTFNLPVASATNTGKLSSTDWGTFNGKQNAITLTTTGTSGASTLVGSTLNVPTYATGLQYFAEAQNTSSPNATTPVDSLTAVSGATNADFAIIPKGNGAIIADIPDGLVSGGNKRGTGAVDLQLSRLTNSEVASGNNSVISGGYRNRATNTDASIGGGIDNTASGTQSRVGGGQSNTASSDFTTIGGGASNNASASRCTIGGGASNSATAYAGTTAGGSNCATTNNYSCNLGGNGNTASGDTSSVVGGASNVASGTYSLAGGGSSIANSYGSVVLGVGGTANSVRSRNVFANATTGDAQKSTFIFRQRTTDATLTTFTIEGTGASTTNQITLSNNSSYRFKGTIIAKQSGSTNVAAWDIDGLLVRGANAGTTTLLIGNVTLVQNTSAWGTPILSTDTTAGALKIQIQGASATNIQWVANIETTEVIYA
jgi:hypothetical protein